VVRTWEYEEVFVRITPDQAVWVRGGATTVVAAQEGRTPRTVLTPQLRAMGAEGWELVAVVNDDVTEVEEGQGFRFYFKRPAG
jgi:hypothetical protein